MTSLHRNQGARFKVFVSLLGMGLLLSIVLSVAVGTVSLPFERVVRIVLDQGFPGTEQTWSAVDEHIGWLIRFPRVLLAVFVGAGLAVVGVCMQAVVRNPLADPYILGISSGASVGAVTAFGLGVFAFAGIYAVSLAVFLGAVLTFLVVFALAQRRGQLYPQRMILAGVGAAYVLSSITGFITLTSDNRFLAGEVLSWTLGSLAKAD